MSLLGFHIDFWTIWGFLAQGVFFSSFVVQWWKSERSGHSHLPLEFWYIRLVGSAMIFVYSFVRRDVVFLAATVLQSIMFARNISLTTAAQKKSSKPSSK